jgi:hypothetical protein
MLTGNACTIRPYMRRIGRRAERFYFGAIRGPRDSAQLRKEQTYSQMPAVTSTVKPLLPGTSKYVFTG